MDDEKAVCVHARGGDNLIVLSKGDAGNTAGGAGLDRPQLGLGRSLEAQCLASGCVDDDIVVFLMRDDCYNPIVAGNLIGRDTAGVSAEDGLFLDAFNLALSGH
jgi:hypothetical protein